MECRTLARSEYGVSDAFVTAAPGGTLFHTTAWLEPLGLPYRIYACTSGGNITAVMPVVEQRRLGMTCAVQPLLTPYLGIVTNDAGLRPVTRVSQWKEIATTFARALQQDYAAADVNLTPHWPDVHGFMWSGYSTHVRYTYTIDLGALDRAWEEMDAKRRNDIRRAQKDGVIIEESSDFTGVMRNVIRTFDRQDMQPRFGAVAERVHAALAARGRCSGWLARSAGTEEPVAAVYLVWDERRAYYLLGGYDGDHAHGGAHALAIWTAIQAMAARGLEQFDFEGSDVPQIERYFRKFGGRLTPYYRVRWESPRMRMASAIKATVAPPARVLRRVFRR